MPKIESLEICIQNNKDKIQELEKEILKLSKELSFAEGSLEITKMILEEQEEELRFLKQEQEWKPLPKKRF